VGGNWAGEAADLLVAAVRGGGHIALSGGSTPRPVHERAAEIEPDWSRCELWWGDERCVPHEDLRSNYRLARESILDLVAQPPGVHPVRTEHGPEEAALAYDQELDGVELDLALLGVGPDGHTASLFPQASTLAERQRRAIAAEAGLEPFVPRVTMTVPYLSAAKVVLFLVVGAEKADAVARAFDRPPSPATPAGLIRSREGRTVAVLDEAAAARLQAAG